MLSGASRPRSHDLYYLTVTFPSPL
ncbi:hypothetical protein A2U01_0116240, partial [Trifolium medium]|nr:hypothetical protein [Trifolium medium]